MAAKKKDEQQDQVTLTQTVTGDSVEEVARKVGAEKDKDNGASEDVSFSEAARSPKNHIQIIRQTPKRFRGRNIVGPLDSLKCPSSRDKIEAFVKEEYGGGTFWVGIMDEKDQPVAAITLEIMGDPKLPDDDELPFDDLPPPPIRFRGAGRPPFGFSGEEDPSAALERHRADETRSLERELAAKRLRREIRRMDEADSPEASQAKRSETMMERMFELLAQQNQNRASDALLAKISDLERKLEAGGGSRVDEAVRRMEERILDVRRDADRQMEEFKKEMERREEAHRREIEREREIAKAREDDLKRQLEDRKADQQNKTFLEIMSKQLETANANANNVAQAAKDQADRTVQMFEKLADHQSKIGEERMKLMLGAFEQQADSKKDMVGQIRDVLGIVSEIAPMMVGGGEHEPEDIPSRLIKVVDKVLPEYMKMMAKPTDPNVVTPAQKRLLMADYVRKEATRQAAQVMEAERARTQAQPQPVQPAPSTASVGTPMGPATPPQTPPPVAPAPIGVPMGPPAAPTQFSDTSPALLKLKQEYTAAVDAVLKAVLDEAGTRPPAERARWVSEAWDNLPDTILQGLIDAQSEDDIYAVVKEWASAAMIDALIDKGKGPEGVAMREWVIHGVNRIKQLAAEEAEEGTQ
jgi:hypothetical protein